MFDASVKQKAIKLRRKGYSQNEIRQLFGISQSTASLWLKGIKLSEKAQQRIQLLGDQGREKALESNRRRRTLESVDIQKRVEEYFSKGIKLDPKIACALLYWGEGTKHSANSSVSFMNADPAMIEYFLSVFRKAFFLDEKKLRALVHLHEYHDIKKQQEFWSSVTQIPLSQFNKSYIKPHTGKNKKDNYPGCISIRYSDSKIYKEIMAVIQKLAVV